MEYQYQYEGKLYREEDILHETMFGSVHLLPTTTCNHSTQLCLWSMLCRNQDLKMFIYQKQKTLGPVVKFQCMAILGTTGIAPALKNRVVPP